MIDEFGKTLQEAANQQNSYSVGVLRLCMEIYGLSFSKLPARHYADSRRSISAVKCPFLSTLHTTTSGSFFGALTTSMASDGFLNRPVVVSMDGSLPPKKPVNVRQLPEAIADRVVEISENKGDWENDTFEVRGKQYRRIAVEPEVEGLIGVFDEYVEEILRAGDDNAPFWMRAVENTIRVAGVLALGGTGTITFADWQYAERMVRRSCMKLADEFAGNVAESAVHAHKLRVLRALRDANGKEMSLSELTRKTQNLNARERKAALDDLVTAGAVKSRVEEKEARGPRITWYSSSE